MNLDYESIEKLVTLVAGSGIEELDIRSEDTKIRIVGRRCPPPPPTGGFGMQPMAAAPAPAPAAVQQAPAAAVSGNTVKSPLVGTFYAAPAPDKAPFVSVGQTVHKGDILMIIESMKVMNEVASEYDGVVKQILVSSGDMVEYDQPLMIIE